ncbi:MAG: hypothetical protein ABIG20_00400 [archaeon]
MVTIKQIKSLTTSDEVFDSKLLKGLSGKERKVMKLVWLANHKLDYKNPLVLYKLVSQILDLTEAEVKEIFEKLQESGKIELG